MYRWTHINNNNNMLHWKFKSAIDFFCFFDNQPKMDKMTNIKIKIKSPPTFLKITKLMLNINICPHKNIFIVLQASYSNYVSSFTEK